MTYTPPSTRARRDTFAQQPRLHLHEPNNRASWKRYGGEGTANAELIAYKDGRGSLKVEETAFADKTVGDKRDVTRGGSMELSRDGMDELFGFLADALGYDVKIMQTALAGAKAVIVEPERFTLAERMAVLEDVDQALAARR